MIFLYLWLLLYFSLQISRPVAWDAPPGAVWAARACRHAPSTVSSPSVSSSPAPKPRGPTLTLLIQRSQPQPLLSSALIPRHQPRDAHGRPALPTAPGLQPGVLLPATRAHSRSSSGEVPPPGGPLASPQSAPEPRAGPRLALRSAGDGTQTGAGPAHAGPTPAAETAAPGSAEQPAQCRWGGCSH